MTPSFLFLKKPKKKPPKKNSWWISTNSKKLRVNNLDAQDGLGQSHAITFKVLSASASDTVCQACLPRAPVLYWQEAECSSCSLQNTTERRDWPLAVLKLWQSVAERKQAQFLKDRMMRLTNNTGGYAWVERTIRYNFFFKTLLDGVKRLWCTIILTLFVSGLFKWTTIWCNLKASQDTQKVPKVPAQK